MQRFLFLIVLAPFSLSAADFFVSPAGAGKLDGTSATNAAAGASANSIFNEKMQPGDRLLFGAGIYKDMILSLSKGGTAEKPKVIQGTAETVFQSSWSIENPDKGATAISLGAGLTGVTLKNLTIKNYCFSIRANPSPDAPRNHLVFDGIQMEHMRHGIYFSDCDNVQIAACTMKRYSKHGFRFDQGCDKVTLKNCVADCSEGDPVWETKTEVFTFGFNINKGGSPNTGFLFEDCVAKNNIKSNQTGKYTNGDGFVAEGNTTDLTFLRCHALRNQDGGFDIKVKDVKFIDCIALGHRRDFRLWGSGTLENCIAGWSATGLWANGGPITATSCVFINHRNSAAEVEDKAPAPATLKNCVISSDPAAGKFRPTIGKVIREPENTLTPERMKADPRYLKAVGLGKTVNIGPQS